MCLWAGLAMMPLFLGGFLLAGFIPPPAPGTPAAELAAMFAQHRIEIRIGMFLATVGSALLCFLFAAIASQLRRIEGGSSPLVYVQLVAGACAVLEFIFPLFIWQTAVYRGERAAVTVQLLNDLAWLPFLGITSTFLIQQVVIALVILRDRADQGELPRWLAYLNLWTAVGICPGSFVVFVHDGPLSWNGLLAWWVLLVSFFIWLVATGGCMLTATRRWAAAPVAPSTAQLARELAELRAQLEATVPRTTA
jgi:hypothetical protein